MPEKRADASWSDRRIGEGQGGRGSWTGSAAMPTESHCVQLIRLQWNCIEIPSAWLIASWTNMTDFLWRMCDRKKTRTLAQRACIYLQSMSNAFFWIRSVRRNGNSVGPLGQTLAKEHWADELNVYVIQWEQLVFFTVESVCRTSTMSAVHNNDHSSSEAEKYAGMTEMFSLSPADTARPEHNLNEFERRRDRFHFRTSCRSACSLFLRIEYKTSCRCFGGALRCDLNNNVFLASLQLTFHCHTFTIILWSSLFTVHVHCIGLQDR